VRKGSLCLKRCHVHFPRSPGKDGTLLWRSSCKPKLFFSVWGLCVDSCLTRSSWFSPHAVVWALTAHLVICVTGCSWPAALSAGCDSPWHQAAVCLAAGKCEQSCMLTSDLLCLSCPLVVLWPV
jgi:hypothetical protein